MRLSPYFGKVAIVMTTTDLGACEWFVWDLRRSNLIDRGQLDQVIGEFLKKQPRAEPAALAQYLVDQEILTPFQADRLLQSKTQGLVLGPYTLTDALGSGSMGTVYKAVSKNDQQWYAVKVLPRRSMWNVRIARRQVRAFEQIQHPSVVPFVDVGTAGSTHYLAWPLVEGEGLDQMVQRLGKLAPETAALFAYQTAEGLDACHQQSLFHGLLKPSNLMVGLDGKIRILDLGIGMLLANSEGGETLVDTMSTANTMTSGLDCASPECIMEPTNRTPLGDQYSLGCVLYYCLTGRYPFPDGTAVEKMMAHQEREPPPIKEFTPEVSDALVELVNRLMRKKPAGRYPSTTEVIDALKPLAPAPSLLAPRVQPRVLKPTTVAAAAANGPGSARAKVQERPAPAPEPGAVRTAASPALPTRQSLRPDPVPEPAPLPPVHSAPIPRRTPRILPAEEQAQRPFAQRFGMAALVIGALVAAGITWVVSMKFFR
jgi:serine/threonine-protein kinase